MNDVTNPIDRRPSRGAFNDITSFYSTVYSTSYNKDFPSTDINQYNGNNSGYVTNLKPYVSLTPDWNSKSKSKFYSDQFVTITDQDYKTFKYPNGLEITPHYYLKGNLTRYGKDRLTTTPVSGQVFNESSEQSDAYRLRRANPYTKRELFLSNIVPNKSPRRLGAQVYELCDPKGKLKPWANLPVTSEDFVDPFLLKSVKHNPSINEKAVRTTGITLPKPLTGEDWYPFDQNIEKSKPDSHATNRLGHVPRLNEPALNGDPCRIIDAKFPRLVSVQGADYRWPDVNYGRTPRTMEEYNKNCMPSAYRKADKSEVLPQTSRIDSSMFETETAREFVHQTSPSGDKGHLGNFTRVGIKDPRIMRQEEMRVPVSLPFIVAENHCS